MIPRSRIAALPLVALLALTGCSSTPAESATETADRLAADVATAGDVTTITEDNDPNDLLGRPGGYTDAAIIEDDAGDCTELGTACGVSVEVWPSEGEAQDRADYIREQLDATPAFGTEYHTVQGPVLLRVTGDVPPSVADQYAAAFEG